VDGGMIEQAAARARAAVGEDPRAILPVRRHDGAYLFVCAFGEPPALRWAVMDEAGGTVADVGVIRNAVEVAATCESAEEAVGALALDEALPALDRAHAIAVRLDEQESAIAADEVRRALRILADDLGGAGLRVAEASYLDRVSNHAQLVGDRFDLLAEAAGGITARLSGAPGDPLEPLAEALWAVVRLLARDGAPDRFQQTMEGAIGAAAALADDVHANYVITLEDDLP